jgi:cytochrome c556
MASGGASSGKISPLFWIAPVFTFCRTCAACPIYNPPSPALRFALPDFLPTTTNGEIVMSKKIVLALAALAVSASALTAHAQQALKPEQAIKYRQSAYSYISWNMTRIKNNVEGANYNKSEVIQAANAIAAIANSGMGALYIPGSDKDAGGVKTYVKPEFFTKQQDVARLAQNFTKEASELARIAASGDAAAVKAQQGKLGGTCKACHDDFKMKN